MAGDPVMRRGLWRRRTAAGAPAGLPPPSRVERPPRRLWLVFAAAIVLSFFVHEIGHCLVAWVHGCPAIPTPAKEYLLRPLPDGVQNTMALAGVLGSVAALAGALGWLFRRPTALRSAVLAGAMTGQGFYALRFWLAGRGHDETEFQEAQAALGLSYSGHALDWMFVGLFVLAAAAWFWRVRPPVTARLIGRLLLGAVFALVVLIALQVGNNALFDPLLQR